MQMILLGLTLLGGGLAPPAAAETVYPWCRQSGDGSINCGFRSQQQCQDTAVGTGAICLQNPNYQEPAAASGNKKGRR
jgi:hypothetical protein